MCLHRRTLAVLFVLALAVSAKAQQASIFHIHFDQPISTSLPECPNRNWGMCWVMHPDKSYSVVGGPFDDDMAVKVNDHENVIAVVAWFKHDKWAYIMEALTQKYGNPSVDNSKDAVWLDALPGGVSVSFLVDVPNSYQNDGMVMVETPEARAGGLTDKF